MAAAGTRAGAAPDMAGFELVVGGMTCAACAARVQAKLNKVTGVTASVNLSTERAYVTAPAQLSARDLIDVVEAAGYTAELAALPEQDAGADATAALWKFFHVYYQRQPTDDPDAKDWLTGQKLTYDVEHSNTLIFLSADGKQRYIVDAAADTGDNRPPPALIRFMTPQGRHNLYHPGPGGSWTVPQAMQVLSWLAGRTIATGSS